MPAKSDGRGFTLIELLVVMAIIGVLIALLLPAVQSARGAARRVECVNNMMQMGLAMQGYEAAYMVLPPGVVNETGPIAEVEKGYHFSWLAQALPFLDQRNVYNHLNFQQGAYAPANTTARMARITTFLCPADPAPVGNPARSNIAGAHHHAAAPIDATNTGLLFLNSSVRTEDIADGASQTVLMGERLGFTAGSDFGWASGTSSTLRNGGWPIAGPGGKLPAVPNPVGGFGSYHPGGANFGFADGSVKFLKSSLSLAALGRMIHRADGEMLLDDE